jgi:hypothetical protein
VAYARRQQWGWPTALTAGAVNGAFGLIIVALEMLIHWTRSAWSNRRGDMSQVPLAEDLVFRGPVASFDSAEGYRAMARQAGAAVTSFRVRYQLCDGHRVCSVVDWTMAPVPGTLSAAEVLEIRDHFPPPDRDQAHAAVAELAATLP